ncbi:unnamed protein product, partial [Sphacelaria rigidula]
AEAFQHYSSIQPVAIAYPTTQQLGEDYPKHLRRWAKALAKKRAKDTWASMLQKCELASPSLRTVVLCHLRAVENPSKVSSSLGIVADSLMKHLELHEASEG